MAVDSTSTACSILKVGIFTEYSIKAAARSIVHSLVI